MKLVTLLDWLPPITKKKFLQFLFPTRREQDIWLARFDGPHIHHTNGPSKLLLLFFFVLNLLAFLFLCFLLQLRSDLISKVLKFSFPPAQHSSKVSPNFILVSHLLAETLEKSLFDFAESQIWIKSLSTDDRLPSCFHYLRAIGHFLIES